MKLRYAFEQTSVPQDWRDESKQPRCNICGQFAYKRYTPDGEFIRWALRCVFYDYWSGGYEHD